MPHGRLFLANGVNGSGKSLPASIILINNDLKYNHNAPCSLI